MGFKGDPVRLLVVPGLNDSGPAHWQTWLQAHFARRAVRVEQDDWASDDLARWSRQIEATLARHPGSRWVAVAHSFGCLALLRVWGSQLINLGDAGHINTDAGFGPLPQANGVVEGMVQRLERERRIDRANPLDFSFSI